MDHHATSTGAVPNPAGVSIRTPSASGDIVALANLMTELGWKGWIDQNSNGAHVFTDQRDSRAYSWIRSRDNILVGASGFEGVVTGKLPDPDVDPYSVLGAISHIRQVITIDDRINEISALHFALGTLSEPNLEESGEWAITVSAGPDHRLRHRVGEIDLGNGPEPFISVVDTSTDEVTLLHPDEATPARVTVAEVLGLDPEDMTDDLRAIATHATRGQQRPAPHTPLS